MMHSLSYAFTSESGKFNQCMECNLPRHNELGYSAAKASIADEIS